MSSQKDSPLENTTDFLPNEFTVKAREHQPLVLFLFLTIPFSFGIVSYFFFDQSLFNAGAITVGLGLIVLGSIPVSRLNYKLCDTKIERIDLTHDRFSATTSIPLLAATGIFIVLFFSLPAIYYLYIGIACIIILPLSRHFFPLSVNKPSQTLLWVEVKHIIVEPKKHAFLLAATLEGGSTKKNILVFCPPAEFSSILETCKKMTHLEQVEEKKIVT